MQIKECYCKLVDTKECVVFWLTRSFISSEEMPSYDIHELPLYASLSKHDHSTIKILIIWTFNLF